MSFDYFADLATPQACPPEPAVEASGLASGFVDGCTTWFAINEIQAAECEAQLKSEQDENRNKELRQKQREYNRAKNDARGCYMRQAAQESLALPADLNLDPWPPTLLHGDWLALEVEFELLTPWYSKDDRPFHVLDNPVRKERVFGVPFMTAASWKGMLRWAFLMVTKLIGPDQEKDASKRKQAKAMELHLFGNEKGEERSFHQGALVFYPTWFNKIGFEVINPHDRSRRAGKQPIYYEVVPPGTEGKLRLLYAPWPEPEMKETATATDVLSKLLEAAEALLTTYGVSAKRTVGWGTAKVTKWQAWKKDDLSAEAASRQELWDKVKSWLPSEGGS